MWFANCIVTARPEVAVIIIIVQVEIGVWDMHLLRKCTFENDLDIKVDTVKSKRKSVEILKNIISIVQYNEYTFCQFCKSAHLK